MVTQPFLGVNEGIWVIVIGGRETVANEETAHMKCYFSVCM